VVETHLVQYFISFFSYRWRRRVLEVQP